MKTGAAGINAHILLTTTSLCHCVKVVRTDGVEFGVTSLDDDLTYDGLLYEANGAITRSAIENRDDYSVQNSDIQGLLNSSLINDDDIRAGRYESAEIYSFEINYENVSDGIIKLQRGLLGDIRLINGMYAAEIRGLTQKIQSTLNDVFSIECKHDFGINDGSIGCFFDLTTVKETGTVGTITDQREFTLTGLTTSTEDYFNQGKIKWTSGNNLNLIQEIKDFDNPNSVKLFLKAPFTIQVGDTVEIWPGCDKRFVTCDGYSQVDNFGGFPYIPGADKMFDYPDARV